MKTLITSILLFCGTLLFSQAPQYFNYQAVARDGAGNPLPNQTVALRISILSGSISGNVSYQEIHNSTTNQLGLITLAVGAGMPQMGTFSSIDWGGNAYFVQVEMDVTGGTNYQLFGTSQLLSVPYALYAKRSEFVDSLEWKQDSYGIHYNQGNVGIGNSSDTSSVLSISKDIPNGFGRYMLNLNNTSISGYSNSSIKLKAGNNNSYLELTQWAPTYTAVPDFYDFGGIQSWGRGLSLGIQTNGALKIVSGFNTATPTELARVNATGMGLGTSTPLERLHIVGNSLFQDSDGSPHIPIKFLDDTGITRGQFRMINDPSYSILEIDAIEPIANGDVSIRFFRYTNTSGSKAVNFLRGNNSAQMSASIGVDGVNSYFQNHGGNLGIGNNDPNSKLHVTGGDIYIENINSGVIMKAPNGSCYRMTVSNAGTAVFTAIPCP